MKFQSYDEFLFNAWLPFSSQLADLPPEWQCEKSLDVIRHVSQRVVMLYIPRMSSERPTSIFSDRPHYGGTGFAYYVDRDVVKVRLSLSLSLSHTHTH